MPRKTMTFQNQFPGLKVDSDQQTHLLRLAATYAGYKRDVSSLAWLLQIPDLSITPDDKIKLRYGWADASMKLDFTADMIGENALPYMVCPNLSASSISNELNLCGERIAPVYQKYRRAYFSQQLNDWVDLYKQSDSMILKVASTEPKLRTPVDKLALYSVMEIRSNITGCARELGLKPDTVFQDVRNQKFTALLEAEGKMLKAKKEQKIANNSQKIVFLLRKIEDTVATINSISESVRPSLDVIESLQRDLVEFEKITGYALAEWYRQNQIVSEIDQKQR